MRKISAREKSVRLASCLSVEGFAISRHPSGLEQRSANGVPPEPLGPMAVAADPSSLLDLDSKTHRRHWRYLCYRPLVVLLGVILSFVRVQVTFA